MTPEEQAQADDNMRAVIAQMIAETGKIVADSRKISADSTWYTLVLAIGFVTTVSGLTAALTTLLIKLFGA